MFDKISSTNQNCLHEFENILEHFVDCHHSDILNYNSTPDYSHSDHFDDEKREKILNSLSKIPFNIDDNSSDDEENNDDENDIIDGVKSKELVELNSKLDKIVKDIDEYYSKCRNSDILSKRLSNELEALIPINISTYDDDLYSIQLHLKRLLKDNYETYQNNLRSWFTSKISHKEFINTLNSILKEKYWKQVHNRYIECILKQADMSRISITSEYFNYTKFIKKILFNKNYKLKYNHKSKKNEFIGVFHDLIVSKFPSVRMSSMHTIEKPSKSANDEQIKIDSNNDSNDSNDLLIVKKRKRKRFMRIVDDDDEKHNHHENRLKSTECDETDEDDQILIGTNLKNKRKKTRLIQSSDEEDNSYSVEFYDSYNSNNMDAKSSGPLKTTITIQNYSDSNNANFSLLSKLLSNSSSNTSNHDDNNNESSFSSKFLHSNGESNDQFQYIGNLDSNSQDYSQSSESSKISNFDENSIMDNNTNLDADPNSVLNSFEKFDPILNVKFDNFKNITNKVLTPSIDEKIDKNDIYKCDEMIKNMNSTEKMDKFRNCYQEISLPDNVRLNLRISQLAMLKGFNVVDKNVTNLCNIALKNFMRNILTQLISSRNSFLLYNKRIIYCIGDRCCNPYLRNSSNKSTRHSEFNSNHFDQNSSLETLHLNTISSKSSNLDLNELVFTPNDQINLIENSSLDDDDYNDYNYDRLRKFRKISKELIINKNLPTKQNQSLNLYNLYELLNTNRSLIPCVPVWSRSLYRTIAAFNNLND